MATDTRPAWHHVWMADARSLARRSLCSKRQVGCVIVDSRNRVVGSGYNGPPQRYDHGNARCKAWCPQGMGQGETCLSLHAEVNALLFADVERVSGGIAFVTAPPCLKCAMMLAQAGVCVIWWADDGEPLDPMQGLWVDNLMRHLGVTMLKYEEE